MKINVLVTLAATLVLSSGARAETLDFSGLTPGSTVTAGQYSAEGVTFTIQDFDGNLGTPAASTDGFNSPTEGISNSPTGDYPTTEYLYASFSSPVFLDSFTFNNYGDNAYPGSPGTSYTAFDSMGISLASGDLSDVEGTSVAVDLANVSYLDFSNGYADEDTYWEYVLGSLTYGAVPEPSSWALLVGGLVLIGGHRLFRKNRGIQA